MVWRAGTYVPAWPGLNPGYWLRKASALERPFPLNAPHRTYAYLARSLIYRLFTALGFRNEDVVLVPDYHHGNEIRAIRASGATLRFYPVRRTLDLDLEAVARLCRSTPKPRALFVIHYLGWPQPMQEVTALCREHDLTLIEDCALSLLSESERRPLGTFGDFAVFCLYKTLPLPNGGLLVQNHGVLDSLSRSEMTRCGLASVAGQTAERMLQWTRGRCNRVGRLLFAMKRAIGQVLSATGVVRVPVGDIGFDLHSVDLDMSRICHHVLARMDYGTIRQRRRENYQHLWRSVDGAPWSKQLEEGVCPLFFPLWVRDKALAARSFRERGVETVEFWNEGDPQAAGEPAVEARLLRRHLLELPVHQDLTAHQMDYLARQVRDLKGVF